MQPTSEGSLSPYGPFPSSREASPPSLSCHQQAEGSGPRTANKICRVCGDRAYGYNFNVVTCESCKAFFRRNALKNKEFRCPFSGECDINVVSRRFCQKCRLDKCFNVGMKKEWILTDEVRVVKRQKSATSRKRKLPVENSKIPQESSPPIKSEDDSDTVPIPKHLLIRLLEQSKSDTNPNCTCVCTCGARNGSRIYGGNASPVSICTESEDMRKGPAYFGNDLAVLDGMFDESYPSLFDAAISRLFTDSSVVPEAHATHVITSGEEVTQVTDSKSVIDLLSPSERDRVSELGRANEVMTMPLEEITISKPENASMTDVFKMADVAIRRIIKMSKRIDAFRSLCQEDQIALLKGGCTEMMILRGVMTYDAEKNVWDAGGTSGAKPQFIKLEVLKGMSINVYDEHKKYLSTFNSACRNNEQIMLILGAICLFTPERRHILHGEIIKREQEVYFALLRKYVEALFGAAESDKVYDELLQKVQDLHELNENAMRVIMGVNPKDIEPLLIEIFDLK